MLKLLAQAKPENWPPPASQPHSKRLSRRQSSCSRPGLDRPAASVLELLLAPLKSSRIPRLLAYPARKAAAATGYLPLALAFLNTSKYPASLSFLLMTL